ncbi:McrB family protein [Gorillibacterium timonense]|uniref:McrB family protein n=1 Tax=Gorillibacterium timonense TaxID=1689269 RepID=UPI00071D708E|nr:AAA family ATPase [Gorillibacterium timonense]
MIKQVRSWWKDTEIPDLIGRKKVDFSIFRDGTHVPIEFHSEFLEANQGKLPTVGKTHKVTLYCDNEVFEANLININQVAAGREALQLRYNSNNSFKDYLAHTFSHSYQYIMNQRLSDTSGGTKQQILVPDEESEYIEFYKTETPYVYKMKLLPYHSIPNVWWVNQGSTMEVEHAEGILWAPLASSNGRGMYHWDTMAEVKKGDIVLHYANKALRYVSYVIEPAIMATKPASLASSNWEEQGRLVRTEYVELVPSIRLEQFNQQILQLNINQGPIHSVGGVKQGYLFRFTREAIQNIQALTPSVNWPDFAILDAEYDVAISSTDQETEVIPILLPTDNQVSAHLQHIKTYIVQRGFSFPEQLIENFYLSLKTKPFVILAGISGTGKTRLVKLFAEAVGAAEENGQYSQIPVRPDWSDPSDLLGYKDLSGFFKPGPLTRVLVEASKEENWHKPYFICLDEMNLARVEHYFSDLLSILETQSWCEETIRTQRLLTGASLDKPEDLERYESLCLPENVFLIGTVNMDETTHPFSKKVLDRANTLEFNTIDLLQFPDLEAIGMDQVAALEGLSQRFLRADYLQLIDAYASHQELIKQTTDELVKINEILEEIHAHVGFRVRDAVCFYMIYNKRFDLMERDAAFDWQLLQKILPRVQGSHSSVRRVLLRLMEVALGKNSGYSIKMPSLMEDSSELYRKWNAQGTTLTAKYPNSARKLAFMLRRLEEDGFTSFWLS